MKLPRRFRAPKKYVAPCGSCRFPYVTDRKAEVRAMGAYGKNLLAQIDERRQTSCRVVPRNEVVSPHAEVAVSVCMSFRIFSTSVKRRTTAKFACANTNDGKQVAASFRLGAYKKIQHHTRRCCIFLVAPCGIEPQILP